MMWLSYSPHWLESCEFQATGQTEAEKHTASFKAENGTLSLHVFAQNSRHMAAPSW